VKKRAQSVKEFLIVNGISSSKIDVVSYGEERPDRLGSSESAYKANRRVEISLY
jgi:peptidoglycan-associated lipoprotein